MSERIGRDEVILEMHEFGFVRGIICTRDRAKPKRTREVSGRTVCVYGNVHSRLGRWHIAHQRGAKEDNGSRGDDKNGHESQDN